jgi:bacteriocin biosynthesis cyclodehydratase domain-containing protein
VAIVRERDFADYGPSDAEVANHRARRAPGPVTVSQSLLAAALTSEEALHVLAGARPALRNRILTFDQRTLRSHRTRIAPQSSCRLCGPLQGRRRLVRQSTKGGRNS